MASPISIPESQRQQLRALLLRNPDLLPALRYALENPEGQNLVICKFDGTGYSGNSLQKARAARRYLGQVASARGYQYQTMRYKALIGLDDLGGKYRILNPIWRDSPEAKEVGGKHSRREAVLMPPYHYVSFLLTNSGSGADMGLQGLLRSLSYLSHSEKESFMSFLERLLGQGKGRDDDVSKPGPLGHPICMS